MAEAVTPYRQLFHEAGMPAYFIEHLQESAAELEKVSGGKLGHFAKRKGATENIDTEAETLRIELNMVDALVLAALEDHPSKLGEWRTLVKSVRSAYREVSRNLAWRKDRQSRRREHQQRPLLRRCHSPRRQMDEGAESPSTMKDEN